MSTGCRRLRPSLPSPAGRQTPVGLAEGKREVLVRHRQAVGDGLSDRRRVGAVQREAGRRADGEPRTSRVGASSGPTSVSRNSASSPRARECTFTHPRWPVGPPGSCPRCGTRRPRGPRTGTAPVEVVKAPQRRPGRGARPEQAPLGHRLPDQLPARRGRSRVDSMADGHEAIAHEGINADTAMVGRQARAVTWFTRRANTASGQTRPSAGRHSRTPISSMSSRRTRSQASRVSRQRWIGAASPRRVSQVVPFGSYPSARDT
jgi:hypothetical protein